VLAPLVEAGHLVIIQSPSLDRVEGEAVMKAADLGLAVMTTGRTRIAALDQVVRTFGGKKPPLAALVVGRREVRHTRPADDTDHEPRREVKGAHTSRLRTRLRTRTRTRT
jgi:hypothetical protein